MGPRSASDLHSFEVRIMNSRDGGCGHDWQLCFETLRFRTKGLDVVVGPIYAHPGDLVQCLFGAEKDV